MKTPYKIVTLDEAFEAVDKALPLFVDTETCGLYQKIRLLQIYQKGWPKVLMVEWPDPMQVATKLAWTHNVMHSAHYDITVIQQQTGTRWTPKMIDDTFLLARLAFSDKEKFSLDDVMTYVLGYDPYERQKLNKKVLQKGSWDVVVCSQDQLAYAATDVYYMPEVYEAVIAAKEEQSYKLDMLTLRYCLDFQWNGMYVDADRLDARYADNVRVIEEEACPINVNSWQQVRPFIGEVESDDLALAMFSLQGNKKAEQVRKVRKLRKQNSFLDKFDTFDGRIYGKFKPSARSGRLTSNDQNLQQIPRATKDCFGAPPGRVLIYSDYAQVELRTICAITVCKTMEKLFREGADLHGFTAEMLFGPDWTKAHRQLVKTYNFNLLYGGGILMVISILVKQAGVLLDEKTVYGHRKKWRNLWREIYTWQQRGIEKWKKGRLGSTPMGRKYKAKMMTDQLNIENQGGAAEVAKLALHYFMPKLNEYNEEHGTDFLLVNFIHDSFITEGPDDPVHYKAMSVLKAEAMQLAWFEMSKLFPIKDLPMPVDVKVGTNWGDIESDDVEDLWSMQLEPYKMLEQANESW